MSTAFEGTGLKHAFEFDGNLRDSAGTVVVGNPTGSLSYAVGMIDRAIHFDGGGERFQFNPGLYPASDTGSPFSIEVWINPSSLPSGAGTGLGTILGTGGANYGVALKSTGAMTFWGSGVGEDRASAAGVVSPGSWHQCVFTYGDGGATNWKWYINNVLSGSGVLFTNGRDFPWCGDDSTTTRPYLGDMDALRIYDTALTSSMVSALWNGGAGVSFIENARGTLDLDLFGAHPPVENEFLNLDLFDMSRGVRTVPTERFSSIYDKPSGGSSKFNPGFN